MERVGEVYDVHRDRLNKCGLFFRFPVAELMIVGYFYRVGRFFTRVPSDMICGD